MLLDFIFLHESPWLVGVPLIHDKNPNSNPEIILLDNLLESHEGTKEPRSLEARPWWEKPLQLFHKNGLGCARVRECMFF